MDKFKNIISSIQFQRKKENKKFKYYKDKTEVSIICYFYFTLGNGIWKL